MEDDRTSSYEETIIRLMEEHKKPLLDAYFGIDRDRPGPFREVDRL